jgi:hypothetical protein
MRRQNRDGIGISLICFVPPHTYADVGGKMERSSVAIHVFTRSKILLLTPLQLHHCPSTLTSGEHDSQV